MSAAMLIDITNDANTEPYPGWLPEHSEAFGRFLLEALHMPAGCELSLAFIDPEPMAQLHQQWLGLDGPTDVMSFPMDELREAAPEPGHLGDVVICPEVAAEQAVQAGHSPRAEVELLLTHGVLHLLGHDHAEPGEHAVMFAKQAELLAAWQAARAAESVSAGQARP